MYSQGQSGKWHKSGGYCLPTDFETVKTECGKLMRAAKLQKAAPTLFTSNTCHRCFGPESNWREGVRL